jgi:hypothetical protein
MTSPPFAPFLPDTPPFGLAPAEKRSWLAGQVQALTAHHRERCPAYARLVDDWERHRTRDPLAAEDFPFVPVTVFKEYDLKSSREAVMSLRSSATTTGAASRIYVDKPTRHRQSLSANRILADFVGTARRPYLVFDVEATVRGVEAMSARGAAIMSLGHLATEIHFLLRDDGSGLALDEGALARALAAVGDAPFIAYGFTWILYQMHQAIAARPGLARHVHPESVLLHSGGWKRLAALAVDKPVFNASVSAPWGLRPDRVIDFYGSVEQVGVPYPDCAQGVKHVPYWAEVVVRRSDSLEPAAPGEPGLLHLINCLPLSAPNHSVLTEDLGAIVCEDGCACGRRGRAFVFRGRAPKSDIRGCSDVWRS